MSIGNLIQDILQSAKAVQEVKTAELAAIKEGEARPVRKNELAAALQKLAEEIKHENADITVKDLNDFVRSV